jgi:hypothetical protein
MDNLNEIRNNTLKQIEANERRYKLAFVGAALTEAVFLGLFLTLADLTERGHLLLLVTGIAIYTVVLFGLIALGLHVNRNTLRVIRAIEALDR